MISGKLRIQITRNNTVSARVVAIYGTVTANRVRVLLAPSSAAASNSSSGTDWSAARIIIAKNVTPYQTFATITATIAVVGWESHGMLLSMSPTLMRISLTTPNSPLNIHRKRIPMRNPEIAHGKKTKARNTPRNINLLQSQSARPNPIMNCGTRDAPTQMTVLRAIVPKDGPVKMVTKLWKATHGLSN